jgi:Ca2+-binding EF-hand superfamily protein
MTVVKQLDFNETSQLRQEFDYFDKDNSGALSKEEIKLML